MNAEANQRALLAYRLNQQSLRDVTPVASEKRLAEEARIVEEKRLAELARIAEEERLAELARIEQEKLLAELARIADEERQATILQIQQPMAPDDEKQYLSRLQQMDSLGDRAFDILMNLGIIQVCSPCVCMPYMPRFTNSTNEHHPSLKVIARSELTRLRLVVR